MEANEVAVPPPKPGRCPGGSPRLRRRDALQRGGADDHRQGDGPREHVGVLAGESAPARGGQGRAVARHAGSQRGGLGEPEREPIGGAGFTARATLRPAVGERPSPRPRPAARSPSAAGRPRRRSIWRSNASPQSTGGRKESASTAALRVEAPQLLRDHLPLADQQRGGRPGVQRDLEALAQLGVVALPVPAGEPWDQREVGGARDRQQLGRPLHGAEDDRPRRSLCNGLLLTISRVALSRTLA